MEEAVYVMPKEYLEKITTDLIPVGEFYSEGDILVTDPCYDIGTWCSGAIKVKPGKYKAFVKKCFVKNWGERIQSLFIVHESTNINEHNYVATDIDVGVDSGQAGFFNRNLFKEDFQEEIPLIGEEQYERHCNLRKLEMEQENRVFSVEALKRLVLKDTSQEELERISKEREEYIKIELAEAKKNYENIDPNNCAKSKDFYEICCSLTLADSKAGVAKFGVVSSSGFGDGSYNCFVNQGNEIVASFIEFIPEEEECQKCGLFEDECICDQGCDGIGDGCEGNCEECSNKE